MIPLKLHSLYLCIKHATLVYEHPITEYKHPAYRNKIWLEDYLTFESVSMATISLHQLYKDVDNELIR